MSTALTFRYDRAGDILYIDTCRPYQGQDSEEVDDGVVARINPTTGGIENLELLFFLARLSQEGEFQVPVAGELRLTPKT